MDARTVAHLYATLKYEWKALEEVRKFLIVGPIAMMLDEEISDRRRQLKELGKKLENIEIKEAE